MVFIDNEEFNVDLYDWEFEYLIASNQVKIKLLKTQEEAKEHLQGDFLGIQTQDYPPIEEEIYISIFSDNNRKKILEKIGRIANGQQTYVGYCTKDQDIDNEDTIIYKNQEFIVQMDTQAEKSGQLSFKKFDLIANGRNN